MPAPSQFEVGNRLLRTMAPESFERLKSDLELVEIPQRQSLVDSDVPISHLPFLEMGLASVIAANADSEEIEVGRIGPGERPLQHTRSPRERPWPDREARHLPESSTKSRAVRTLK